jgi:hypothetical protein
MRRLTAIVLVVSLHGFFFSFIHSPSETRSRQSAARSQKTVLFLAEVTPTEPKQALSKPSRSSRSMHDSEEGTLTLSSPSRPAIATKPSAREPSIDWELEGERAAAAIAKKLIDEAKAKCNPPGVENPLLPKCAQPAREFEWAPSRAGFSDGLPYVRVGENCVVGLGFFGCGIGKKPANGQLLDSMRDPDRDPSSVPPSN